MNITDIKKQIANILTSGGFNVISREISEGFKKPAVFVSVHPSSHTRLMCGLEEITDSVEVKYIPNIESEEDCIKAEERLLKLLYYSPISVLGHTFTVEKTQTEIEDYIMYFSFDLTYEQTMPEDDDFETMEILEMEVE